MHLSNFKKSLTRTLVIVGAINAGMLVQANSVDAYSIGFGDDFSSGSFTNWDTYGDTLIQDTIIGDYDGFSRSYNAGTGDQATLSTACPNATGTECYVVGDPDSARDDDPSSPIGTYNFSGSDQNDANSETDDGTNLQSIFDLDPNALNIQAEEGDTIIEGGSRLPKEGSAMILNDYIYADHEFEISFDWSFLTNDGQAKDEVFGFNLGDSDYAFVTIYEKNSDVTTRIPIVLADSDATAIPEISNLDDAYALSKDGTYVSEPLPAGDYVVGFGVVDVWDVNRSSALLVDNFFVKEVPFEFSPSLGMFASVGIIGLLNGYKKFSQDN